MSKLGRTLSRPALLAIPCAALLALATSGCGKTSGAPESSGGSNGGGSSSGAVPLSKVKNGPLTIGFSNYASVIPFYQSMIAGVKDEAAKYGWKVEVTDSGFDPNKQLADVTSLITRRVDVLVISPGDQDALVPAYQAAAQAGIPVVSIANRPNRAGLRYETAFFGVSNERLGENMTRELVRAMKRKGDVLQVKGPPGIAFAAETAAGAARVFAQNPGMKVVYSQSTKQLSAEEGFRVAQDGLTAHPAVQGGWAADDELAVGLIRALQKRNLAGRIPVTWNGGTPQTMDLAAKGQLIGIILPTYSWGTGAIDRVHGAVANGRPFAGAVNAPMFPLKSAKQARELIARCPQTPRQLWCLGRR
jgi:ABC-type sugar transport system substrate-binding protein